MAVSRRKARRDMRTGVGPIDSSDRKFLNVFRCVLALAIARAVLAGIYALSYAVGGPVH